MYERKITREQIIQVLNLFPDDGERMDFVEMLRNGGSQKTTRLRHQARR